MQQGNNTYIIRDSHLADAVSSRTDSTEPILPNILQISITTPEMSLIIPDIQGEREKRDIPIRETPPLTLTRYVPPSEAPYGFKETFAILQTLVPIWYNSRQKGDLLGCNIGDLTPGTCPIGSFGTRLIDERAALAAQKKKSISHNGLNSGLELINSSQSRIKKRIHVKECATLSGKLKGEFLGLYNGNSTKDNATHIEGGWLKHDGAVVMMSRQLDDVLAVRVSREVDANTTVLTGELIMAQKYNARTEVPCWGDLLAFEKAEVITALKDRFSGSCHSYCGAVGSNRARAPWIPCFVGDKIIISEEERVVVSGGADWEGLESFGVVGSEQPSFHESDWDNEGPPRSYLVIRGRASIYRELLFKALLEDLKQHVVRDAVMDVRFGIMEGDACPQVKLAPLMPFRDIQQTSWSSNIAYLTYSKVITIDRSLAKLRWQQVALAYRCGVFRRIASVTESLFGHGLNKKYLNNKASVRHPQSTHLKHPYGHVKSSTEDDTMTLYERYYHQACRDKRIGLHRFAVNCPCVVIFWASWDVSSVDFLKKNIFNKDKVSAFMEGNRDATSNAHRDLKRKSEPRQQTLADTNSLPDPWLDFMEKQCDIPLKNTNVLSSWTNLHTAWPPKVGIYNRLSTSQRPINENEKSIKLDPRKKKYQSKPSKRKKKEVIIPLRTASTIDTDISIIVPKPPLSPEILDSAASSFNLRSAALVFPKQNLLPHSRDGSSGQRQKRKTRKGNIVLISLDWSEKDAICALEEMLKCLTTTRRKTEDTCHSTTSSLQELVTYYSEHVELSSLWGGEDGLQSEVATIFDITTLPAVYTVTPPECRKDIVRRHIRSQRKRLKGALPVSICTFGFRRKLNMAGKSIEGCDGVTWASRTGKSLKLDEESDGSTSNGIYWESIKDLLKQYNSAPECRISPFHYPSKMMSSLGNTANNKSPDDSKKISKSSLAFPNISGKTLNNMSNISRSSSPGAHSRESQNSRISTPASLSVSSSEEDNTCLREDSSSGNIEVGGRIQRLKLSRHCSQPLYPRIQSCISSAGDGKATSENCQPSCHSLTRPSIGQNYADPQIIQEQEGNNTTMRVNRKRMWHEVDPSLRMCHISAICQYLSRRVPSNRALTNAHRRETSPSSPSRYSVPYSNQVHEKLSRDLPPITLVASVYTDHHPWEWGVLTPLTTQSHLQTVPISHKKTESKTDKSDKDYDSDECLMGQSTADCGEKPHYSTTILKSEQDLDRYNQLRRQSSLAITGTAFLEQLKPIIPNLRWLVDNVANLDFNMTVLAASKLPIPLVFPPTNADLINDGISYEFVSQPLKSDSGVKESDNTVARCHVQCEHCEQLLDPYNTFFFVCLQCCYDAPNSAVEVAEALTSVSLYQDQLLTNVLLQSNELRPNKPKIPQVICNSCRASDMHDNSHILAKIPPWRVREGGISLSHTTEQEDTVGCRIDTSCLMSLLIRSGHVRVNSLSKCGNDLYETSPLMTIYDRFPRCGFLSGAMKVLWGPSNVHPLYTMRNRLFEDNNKVHVGVFCHRCHDQISGVRWKCACCQDVDLCDCCENIWFQGVLEEADDRYNMKQMNGVVSQNNESNALFTAPLLTRDTPHHSGGGSRYLPLQHTYAHVMLRVHCAVSNFPSHAFLEPEPICFSKL